MTTTTSENGLFQFDMPSDRSYRFNAQMTGDYMNGLTTLDLVIIQKHILDIKEIANPYKLLSADANNDKKITSGDILALRNLILGNTQKLDKSDSWKFVNSGYTFENQNNPWTANDDDMYYIVINDLKENMMNNNFIALKVGDVNNSVKVSNSDEVDPRSEINMVYDNEVFKSGQIVEVPVYASTGETIEGLQLSMSYNSDLFDLVDIEGNMLNVTPGHYAIHDNAIFLSWNSNAGVTTSEDKPLFTLKLSAKADGQINNQISLNNELKAEAYNSDLETFKLQFEYEKY